VPEPPADALALDRGAAPRARLSGACVHRVRVLEPARLPVEVDVLRVGE
jgi:hypothetical protein